MTTTTKIIPSIDKDSESSELGVRFIAKGATTDSNNAVEFGDNKGNKFVDIPTASRPFLGLFVRANGASPTATLQSAPGDPPQNADYSNVQDANGNDVSDTVSDGDLDFIGKASVDAGNVRVTLSNTGDGHDVFLVARPQQIDEIDGGTVKLGANDGTTIGDVDLKQIEIPDDGAGSNEVERRGSDLKQSVEQINEYIEASASGGGSGSFETVTGYSDPGSNGAAPTVTFNSEEHLDLRGISGTVSVAVNLSTDGAVKVEAAKIQSASPNYTEIRNTNPGNTNYNGEFAVFDAGDVNYLRIQSEQDGDFEVGGGA